MPNYSGTWALPAQMQAIGSGNWPINGPFTYIEDVFSTYLYTGNNSTQTIANGIDLSTKGGLTWVKARNVAGESNWLFDTVRGPGYGLQSNTINSQANNQSAYNQTFLTNGFSFNSLYPEINASGTTYASWTFAKQAKFFDVVTYTGTGSARTVAHNLGSAPGCIIVKNITNASNWIVYHRSTTATQRGILNTTNAFGANSGMWNDTEPTSTVFTVGTGDTNTSGDSFVAYLFAHDAGGFGTAGTDNVISCGSYVAVSGGNNINLGYEAQFVIEKVVSTTSNWEIDDIMRGMSQTNTNHLYANTSGAEAATSGKYPTATGYYSGGWSPGATVIYIAIRRPMKPPTTGTEVFSPNGWTGNGASGDRLNIGTTNFPIDSQLIFNRSPNGQISGYDYGWLNRLIGVPTYPLVASGTIPGYPALYTTESSAESTLNGPNYWTNTSFGIQGNSGGLNLSANTYISWNFRRASTFFDVVCYTGNRAGRTINHNLTVAPELIIIKDRTLAEGWRVYHSSLGNTGFLVLETTAASNTSATIWNSTSPTSTVFSVGNYGPVNETNNNYVAYLFATVAGVSKVGSYTGTGTTQQIDCGFTGGARFVLIKRTDSNGDWYVWDSARGIVAGNDPYLLLNSTAAEVTNTDYVDTYAAGFEITSTAPAAINANGGSFIFLAIA